MAKIERPEVDPSFVQALLAEDELGAVVRSHIFVEANLNAFLDLSVPNPTELRDLGLRYAQKVALACALGLNPSYKTALVELGRVRNAFAHKLDTQLSQELVANLYAKLPPDGKVAVQQSYERTKTQLKAERKLTVDDLPPREKFILITLSLERFVMAAILIRKAA